MLKLLNAIQIREADKYTIENEPISSLDLMERAAQAFVRVFTERFTDKKINIALFCGKGNNGGDGLAIARMLLNENYTSIQVCIADFTEKSTPDFKYNLESLQQLDAQIFYLSQAAELEIQTTDVIIDALFGIGLNRPLEDEWYKLIKKINQFPGFKVSVDIPSGLPAEGQVVGDAIFKSDWVITFQRPKLNFLLPHSSPYVKEWKVVNIGLDENFIESSSSPYYWFWKKDVQKFIKPRQAFEHKGLLGSALIIAGEDETMGAALLCAEACHKAGTGLTTALIPKSGLAALNARVPEVMYCNRSKLAELNWEKYNVVGIGPGLGTSSEAEELLIQTLNHFKKPVVLDADALNILASKPEFWKNIPVNSVITPHMKEFDRLFKIHQNWWDRIITAFEEAVNKKIFIVLKNRYTMIFSPQGMCYFNSSGSPAMASGGMGDVLTGMITSMIAQGYSVDKAVLLAVFTHGYAGEQLAQNMYVVPATSLIKKIPTVLRELM